MILAGILVIFLGCLLAGVSVVFSILLASGIPIVIDPSIGINQMASIILQRLRSFPLYAIPLYILVGKLLTVGGITDDLVYISRVLVGKIKGALAHMNVVTSIFFAGISGSSVADVASIGIVLIPAMKKKGYSPEFSATLTAASATIGSIIPPSILLIIYGAIAETSIAALFLGGIIPGVFIGLVQMAYSYFYATRHHIGTASEGRSEKITPLMVRKALVKSLFPLSIFLIIIVGITSGVFTPTEAAGVAVVYVLLVLILIYKKRDFRAYLEQFKKAVKDSAVIYLLIASASFLAWVLTYYEVMIPVIDTIKRSNLSPNLFLIILTLIYVVLGTFMEPASAMLIFVPLLLPVVELLQIDPTVVGIVTVMAIRVGTITPPYGLSALMAAELAETNIIKMLKMILIFLIFYLLVIIILIFAQEVIVFLPRLLLK
jgi:tripartite ATP-independent transporter DctM subunit